MTHVIKLNDNTEKAEYAFKPEQSPLAKSGNKGHFEIFGLRPGKDTSRAGTK